MAKNPYVGKFNSVDHLPTTTAETMWQPGRRATETRSRRAAKLHGIETRKARSKIGIHEARAMFQAEYHRALSRFGSPRHIPKQIFQTLTRRIDAVGRYYSVKIRRPKGRAGESVRNEIKMAVAAYYGISVHMVTRCWTDYRARLKRLLIDRDDPIAATKESDRRMAAIKPNPKGAGRKPKLSKRERFSVGLACQELARGIAERAANDELTAQTDSARPEFNSAT